ncbi:MAG: hypothetical protein KGI29_08425 [Pseudomonadota bacterium]|nr:hypothetical protein [Pseudomonadota bacterium]MDE3037977.1 hypothetical protein [Pseudomonadota bacterium]
MSIPAELWQTRERERLTQPSPFGLRQARRDVSVEVLAKTEAWGVWQR